jgi:hypothetical protein
MKRSSKHKINKQVSELNHTVEQWDLTFTKHFVQHLQNAHSSYLHIEHSPGEIMLYHKSSLNKLKKIKIISYIFSGHNGI